MVKRIIFLGVALVFLLTVNCFAAIDQADFNISGISLGSSVYDDVIHKLGEPKKKFEDDYGQPPLMHMSFRGIKVSTAKDSGQVVYIMVDNGDYQTVRGVKVGATPYKVTKVYGQPEKNIIKGHVYYIYHTDPASVNHLLFEMTEGYVSKIILTSMPLT